MNILITGINGFVGKTLQKKLKPTHHVIGIYRSGEILDNDCYKVDLLSEENVLNFCNNYTGKKVDVIVHLASNTANANNLKDISVINDNATLSKNVTELAKKMRVKHIINLSSSSIYPNINGVFNELSVPNPSVNSDCLYGLSKYNAEIIINYFLANTGICITHLRSSIIYGAGMNTTRIIPVLQREIQENNSVTLHGNGERFFNLIKVETLVAYINYFVDNPTNDVFNVSEEYISLLQLAKKLIADSGKSSVKIILKPEGNKSQFKLDTTKLTTLVKLSHV